MKIKRMTLTKFQPLINEGYIINLNLLRIHTHIVFKYFKIKF